MDDAYVAAMKGVMLQIDPNLRFVDVTHNVDAQDIMGAAFVLKQAIPYFPDGTVHLAVVDPDVGDEERNPIAARIGRSFFVGRDNGLLALLLDGEAPDEIVVLDRNDFWRSPTPSRTFHGRDIFAPVAAHLASGRSLSDIGSPTDDLKRLHWAHPISDEEGIQGFVVHVDHFGNCITNISGASFDERLTRRTTKCYVGTAIIDSVQDTYSDVAQGEPVVLVGSSGFLEVAVNGGDAATLLTIHKGSQVNLVFGDSDSSRRTKEPEAELTASS